MSPNLTILEDIIKEQSKPAAPISANVWPKLSPLKGIKAVIFDIYGTLFISASGDISLEAMERPATVMKDALEKVGLEVNEDEASLFERYKKLIQKHQDKSRLKGIEFPEVEIREVWQELLQELGKNADWGKIERLAVYYECFSNPLWPMPGMQETLTHLKNLGIFMGIISNAQFYTPLIFPVFMGKTAQEVGFLDGLSFYSYELLESKPSQRAFKEVKTVLESEHKVSADSVLYVGNDMLNDIYPASQVGFRTALFAGDKRSLRLRSDHILCKDASSDLVITELPQIINCITPHA